jgi:hypothetical protein
VRQWIQWIDDQRVRLHFKHVEWVLRARISRRLSQEQRAAREQLLNALHDYGACGVFPRNHVQPGFAPCFIDRDNRVCAVAHLLITSGHQPQAQHIAIQANDARVPDMTFPELDVWALQAGFSKDEVAFIQPIYNPCTPYTPEICILLQTSGYFMLTAVLAGGAGLLAGLIRLAQVLRGRRGKVAGWIGSLAGLLLLIVSVALVINAVQSYGVFSNVETRSWIDLRYFNIGSVNALLVLGVAGIGGALVISGLSVYRSVRYNPPPKGGLESK